MTALNVGETNVEFIVMRNSLCFLAHFQTNIPAGDEKSVRRTNSFVGTAQFVAPEILKRGDIHFGLVIDLFSCFVMDFI